MDKAVLQKFKKAFELRKVSRRSDHQTKALEKRFKFGSTKVACDWPRKFCLHDGIFQFVPFFCSGPNPCLTVKWIKPYCKTLKV